MRRQEYVVISSGLSKKTAISFCMVSCTSKMVHGRPPSEKHSPATRCRAGAKVRCASKTSLAQKKPLEKYAGTAKSNPSRACFCLPLGHLQWRNAAVRRRGSDRAICAYLKQPYAMTQRAKRIDHLSSPTACNSTLRSSKACNSGGSTTGAWPRCPVALGVVGTCRLLRSSSWSAFLFIHFKAWSARAGAWVCFRYWSRSTISGGAGRPRLSRKVRSSNQVFTTRSMVAFSASLTFFYLFLSHSSAGLFPFGLEGVCQDASWFVRAHADEHRHKAIHPLLNGLAEVLVHVDGLGLLLVDRLADRAESHWTLRVVLHDFGPSCKEFFFHPCSRLEPVIGDMMTGLLGRSPCRHRRSRCLPRGPLTPSTDVPAVQRSSIVNQLLSIQVHGRPLTRVRLPLVLHSSLCRLMPWHCTLTELLRCGEQKDAAVTSEGPPLS